MKRRKVIILAILAIFIVGCSGYRTATLNTSDPDKVTHSGGNFSLLGPTEAGPIELAQAKLTIAIAKQIERGTISSKKYRGVVKNNSDKTVWWLHPEAPIKMEIKPSGFLLLPFDSMPGDITIFRADGRYEILKLKNKPRKYTGIKVNFVVDVNKVE